VLLAGQVATRNVADEHRVRQRSIADITFN